MILCIFTDIDFNNVNRDLLFIGDPLTPHGMNKFISV